MKADGNFLMEWVIKDWNNAERFGIPTPGGVQGIPGRGTPGLGDRLDSEIPEVFSNLSNSMGFCGLKTISVAAAGAELPQQGLG